MAWGYYDWRLLEHCGATPAFAHAALRLEVQCSLDQKDEAAWWRASLQVLEQLTAVHPRLQHWLNRARELEGAIQAPPLRRGWRALLSVFGCPYYPAEWRRKAQAGNASDAEGVASRQSLVAFLGCPYSDFVTRALHLTGVWLEWSHAALQLGRVQLKREEVQRWCAEFDALPKLLPAPALMAMHHRLWQQGITWQWLGEDRTRIGEGFRQQVVRGAPQDLPVDDPETWHIPIYTITGSVGKTTTARLLWQLLQNSGETLALTASDGAWIGSRRLFAGDCIGGTVPRVLLRNPSVQAAVFEQGRGGIIKHGVPYARSDVAILLNVQSVHLGLDGIETLEQMADTKAIGLAPARLWILNNDDAQCRRLADRHAGDKTVWFSVSASREQLKDLSSTTLASIGIERDDEGEPQAMYLWQAGQKIERWSLEGVAPYQGLLGEKTLEELLAAVAAAYFGPLGLSGGSWPERLRALRLDGNNHAFRTSVHRQGNVVFVLDKAAEPTSLPLLTEAVEALASREGFTHRIVALCRPASETPARHIASIQHLFGLMDEFVCFDRPDTYSTKVALPTYAPGSIPILLRDELMRLNTESRAHKPVTIAKDWEQAEAYLRERLGQLAGKTLVLINQPATSVSQLNRKILSFATNGLNFSGAAA